MRLISAVRDAAFTSSYSNRTDREPNEAMRNGIRVLVRQERLAPACCYGKEDHSFSVGISAEIRDDSTDSLLFIHSFIGLRGQERVCYTCSRTAIINALS